jgi:NarL family two-component system response regulator LiaR
MSILPLRVFVIGEQPIFRMGLVTTLSGHAGIQVAGESSHCDDAVQQAPQLGIQVFLLVVDDAPTYMLTAWIEALRAARPTAHVVVLTDDLDEVGHDQLKAAGAGSLLLKCASVQTILHATWTPGYGLDPVARATDRGAPGADLTDRERDLLQLMALGLSNAEISQQLGVAVSTVKFHIGNIMSKLQAANRTAAVLAALRHRLVSLEAAPPTQPFGSEPVHPHEEPRGPETSTAG